MVAWSCWNNCCSHCFGSFRFNRWVCSCYNCLSFLFQLLFIFQALPYRFILAISKCGKYLSIVQSFISLTFNLIVVSCSGDSGEHYFQNLLLMIIYICFWIPAPAGLRQIWPKLSCHEQLVLLLRDPRNPEMSSILLLWKSVSRTKESSPSPPNL